MKTWLDTTISEAIRGCIADRGPQLCCEAGGLDPDGIVRLLLSAFRAWQRDIVIGFFHVGSTTRACLFDMGEIEGILRRVLNTEEVVAIADLTMLGGCSIDFTPEGEGTVEVLLSAWGKHESMAAEIAEKLGNVGTFRGN